MGSQRCEHDLLPNQCADCLGILTPEEEEASELHEIEKLAERLGG